MKQLARRIGRIVLWPLRRFFDPRFAGIATAVEESTQVAAETRGLVEEVRPAVHATDANVRETKQLLAETRESLLETREALAGSLGDVGALLADTNASVAEATEILGRSIADVQAWAERAATEAERLSGARLARLRAGDVSELDAATASLLNRETSSEGFAARSGLWFNPPVFVQYRPGAVVLGGVNERAAEIPYVFRGLFGLEAGAAVLDVGATESTVALSLASLGYEVTALDPRPYPLEHPRLRAAASAVEDWDYDGSFAAVVCISTIEHVGLAAYGASRREDGADLAAMRRMRELTEPGGRLLLTTRYGRAGVDELERTYDRSGLDALLEGWEVRDLTFVRRLDESTWEICDRDDDPAGELVAMVTAVRSG